MRMRRLGSHKAFEYALDRAERTGTAAYVNAQIILERSVECATRMYNACERSNLASSARPVEPSSFFSSPRQREVLEVAGGGLVP